MTNVIYLFGYGAFGKAIAHALSSNQKNEIFIIDKKFTDSAIDWIE